MIEERRGILIMKRLNILLHRSGWDWYCYDDGRSPGDGCCPSTRSDEVSFAFARSPRSLRLRAIQDLQPSRRSNLQWQRAREHHGYPNHIIHPTCRGTCVLSLISFTLPLCRMAAIVSFAPWLQAIWSVFLPVYWWHYHIKAYFVLFIGICITIEQILNNFIVVLVGSMTKGISTFLNSKQPCSPLPCS